jgi:hypothetical protein
MVRGAAGRARHHRQLLRSVAFPEEKTNDLETAFDGTLNAPVGGKLHRLPDTVFVF